MQIKLKFADVKRKWTLLKIMTMIITVIIILYCITLSQICFIIVVDVQLWCVVTIYKQTFAHARRGPTLTCTVHHHYCTQETTKALCNCTKSRENNLKNSEKIVAILIPGNGKACPDLLVVCRQLTVQVSKEKIVKLSMAKLKMKLPFNQSGTSTHHWNTH